MYVCMYVCMCMYVYMCTSSRLSRNMKYNTRIGNIIAKRTDVIVLVILIKGRPKGVGL